MMERFVMEKNTSENNNAKQLTDEELKTVNSGMKIVIDEQPSWWKVILRILFRIKD